MVGDNIKNLRTKNSMTQKDLADKLFVTPQAVSRWENGEVEPSIVTVTNMAKIFGVSVDEIVGNIVEKPAPEVVVEKEYVYKEPPKPVLAVCEKCNKPIYDSKEIVRENYGYSGRSSSSSTHVYCKTCVNKRNERLKRERIEFSISRRVKSFWLGGIAAGIILIISLIYSIKVNNYSWIFAGVAGAILAFSFISCLLLQNNFVEDMTEGIFSWGFVKLPGLIFSLDLEGIIWLLTVKLLFWILGIILAVISGILGIIIGSVVSVFVYPYAIKKNFLHPDEVEMY